MNLRELRQKRAQLVKDMEQLNTEHGAAFTDEQRTQWTTWETELRAVEEQIARAETLESRRADLQRTDSRASIQPGADAPNGLIAQSTPLPDGRSMNTLGVSEDRYQEMLEAQRNFRNLSHFLGEVRFRPGSSELRAFSFESGSEGGFLIPPQFAEQILMVNPQQAIMRPRAMVIPAGDMPDAELTFPALVQGEKGVYGGMQVYWEGESAEVQETDVKLAQVTVKPSEMTSMITLSNRLLRNSTSSSVFSTAALRRTQIGSEDYAELRGDGVGKPLGILKSTGRVMINRNTAATVKYVDITNMMASLMPDSMPNAIWVASQSIMTTLLNVQNGLGQYIFQWGDISKGMPNTLFGIPLIFSGRVPTLGNEADLSLFDPSMYLLKDGVGPLISMSEHVKFKNNQTVIKIVRSVDGQNWMTEALILEDGSTKVSNVVVLK